MKIYSKIRIKMDTGETIHEEYFKYSGPVAQCGGGSPSTTTNTTDPVYNAGMLRLSEADQAKANTLFNMAMYGVEYNPTDKVYDANDGMSSISKFEYSLLTDREKTNYHEAGRTEGFVNRYDPSLQTSEMQYMQNVINKNQEILGLQTEAETANINAQMEGFRTQQAQAKAEGEMIGPKQELELANIGLTKSQIASMKSLILPQNMLSQSDINTQMAQLGLSREQIDAASQLLPMQTDVSAAGLESQLKQLGLSDAQTASALELLPQQTQLSTEEMNSRLKQLGLADEQISSALQLLPQQTALSEAKISAETGLVPQRAGLESEQIAGERTLTPVRTEAEKTSLLDTMSATKERAPVRSEMFKQALEGIDVEGRVGQAQADVEHAFKTAGDTRTREMQRFGLDPSDPKYASMARADEFEKAKAIAGSRTFAKDKAEDEKFTRLKTALTM